MCFVDVVRLPLPSPQHRQPQVQGAYAATLAPAANEALSDALAALWEAKTARTKSPLLLATRRASVAEPRYFRLDHTLHFCV
jgi:hypothetical protein